MGLTASFSGTSALVLLPAALEPNGFPGQISPTGIVATLPTPGIVLQETWPTMTRPRGVSVLGVWTHLSASPSLLLQNIGYCLQRTLLEEH